MKTKKVGLVYGYTTSNHGDVAITKGILNYLNQSRFRVHVVFKALSKFGEPLVVDLLKPLKAPTFSVGDDFSCLDDCDTILFNSGEHLFSNGSAEQDAQMAERLKIVPYIESTGKRLICLPSTFGPFVGERSKNLFDSFVAVCNSITVRDLQSNKVLPASRALPDPAILLPHLAPTSHKGLIISIVPRLENYGLRVGYNTSLETTARMAAVGYKDSASFVLYDQLIKYILGIPDAKAQLLIQTRSDIELVNALYEANKCDRCTVKSAESLDAYRLLLSKSTAIVSSRFHSILLGYSEFIPSVGICFKEHGTKILGLMQLFRQERYYTSNCTANSAIKKLGRLLGNLGIESAEIFTRKRLLERGLREYLTAMV